MPSLFGRRQPSRGGFRFPPRLIMAAVIALIAVVGYYSNTSKNPVTQQSQRVKLSTQEEVALGLRSAPEMARQFGGLSGDAEAAGLVKMVGGRVLAALPAAASVYPFEFHLLADNKTVNAFALPGGQIFITEALLSRLETEGQLAGILGHEVGHVIERHSNEHMASSDFAQGLVGAATVAGSESQGGAQAAHAISSLVANFATLKYGRDDELEADTRGIEYMHAAGYDPRALIRVMEILEQASGGSGQPEFAATHPNPGNRREKIRAEIERLFPGGVPGHLKP